MWDKGADLASWVDNWADHQPASLAIEFKGVETNRNASCIDKIGNIWFGTIAGLMKYNPKNETKNTIN